ncbi:hypothetical protein OG226_48240 [Streptomyces sp. NBC_01261]|uniref:hypothetical protein n=1 Tax=unclassified Streptomyces TaxID=2593676 RepID=UPI002E2AC56D|nr:MULTISPECIES: hypothetical protein [unclassified Streptomyces]
MSAEEDRLRHIPQEPVHLVPVDALSVDACPRLSGEDPDHLRILLETPNELPPILVHRPTMRVIDGMHRLSVARLRGQSQIAVRYFDGAEEDAFVLSVQNNVRHGLPLSLADRTAAATRIARSHPHWSDRTIARTSGLSPKTVAAIRRRSSAEIPPSNTRVGQDGRSRPIDAGEGRRRASHLITAHPTMPLREVATKAGISLGTAHDVSERLRTGRDPLPERVRRTGPRAPEPQPLPTPHLADTPHPPPARTVPAEDTPPSRVLRLPERPRTPATLLHVLRKDPSLRLTDTGRALLRLFDAQAQLVPQWDRLVDSFPQHCADMIIDLADTYATYWQHIAAHLRTATAETDRTQRISS